MPDLLKIARRACGLALVVVAFAGTAMAVPGDPMGVPEIDPSSAVGALTLLSGGVLLLTDRFRRKK